MLTIAVSKLLSTTAKVSDVAKSGSQASLSININSGNNNDEWLLSNHSQYHSLFIQCRLLRIFLLAIIFILLLMIADVSADPRIKGWDSVEAWEVDYCSKEGGTQAAASPITISGKESAGNPLYLSQTTASVQAQHTQLQRLDNKDIYTYEINWYVQPAHGSVDYTVYLATNKTSRNIGSGSATFTEPAIGYYNTADYQKYTTANIVFGEKSITVPIV